MKNILKEITQRYSSFSSSEKKVAEYILKNPDTVILLSMRAMAEKIDLSDNTILRFCRTCGFTGYLDFKSSLIPQLLTKEGGIYKQKGENDPFSIQQKTIIENISNSIKETCNSLIEADLNLAAQKITESNHNYIIGLAASRGVSLILADALHLMSIPASSHSDRVEIERICLSLQKNSLMIGLTNSGETSEVIMGIRRARENGIFTIVISSNITIKQSVNADVFLLTQVPIENITGSYFALPSIVQLSLIELLISKIPDYMQKK